MVTKLKKKYDALTITTYLIPIIFVIAILSIIYYVKGFFPFGHNSIAWGDMYEQTIFYYYKLYDILHGNGSVFYDFSTAMGNNFWGIATYYIFSPFSLLVVLFPRKLIPEFINILLMVKLCAICISSVYFFSRTFANLSRKYIVFFTICYVFCGYTFIMYQTIQFLDFLIIFPLLLLSLRRLYDKGDLIPFMAMLTLAIAINFYIAFMILVFTFFTSLIYLYLYIDKRLIPDRISKLCFSAVVCILITMPITLPTVIEIFKSNRVPTSLAKILSSSYSYTLDKISFFFLSAVIFPFILLLLTKFKENRRFIYLSFSTFFLTMIQIVVDQINLLWQLGSYSAFPLRFGFIPTFMLIISAAYYVNKYESSNKHNLNIIFAIPIVGTFIGATIYVILNYYDVIQGAISTLTLHSNKKVFVILFLLFIVYFCCYFISIKLFNKKYLIYLLSLLLSIQILFNGFIYIGIDSLTPTITSEFNELDNLADSGLASNNFYRVKDLYKVYTSNMTWITGTLGMSQFTSLTNKNHMETLKRLGYSSIWMRVSDIGGTIFTDSLFNIKYLLSDKLINNNYYTLVDTSGKINIYENNYYIPNGIITSRNISYTDIGKSTSVFDAYNMIYRALSADSENLFTEHREFSSSNLEIYNEDGLDYYKIKDSSKPAYVDISLDIDSNKELYLNMLKSVSNEENLDILNSVKVFINDEKFDSSLSNSLYDFDTSSFPSTFNNGLLDLGSYENEIVWIRLEVLKNFSASQMSIGSMDVNKFISFAEENKINASNIQISENYLTGEVVASDYNSMLFLSIPYDDGWTCTINGDSQPIVKVFDNFIGIPLNEGVNTILLRFYPEGFKFGAVICLLTAISLIFVYVVYVKENKFISYKVKMLINNCYSFLYIIMLVLIYLVPLIIYVLLIFNPAS